MVFIDKKKEAYFLKRGYCTFHILESTDIQNLRNIYFRFEKEHGESKEQFKGTGWIESPAVRTEISNLIASCIEEKIGKHFHRHSVLGYGFLTKESSDDSNVPPHQDWTYVDETRFYSFNIWIALEDINIPNGALYVVPFSHKIFSGYLRPAPQYPVPFNKILPLLKKIATPVRLKAGECICFDNKTAHGSFANTSVDKRLVSVATIYPQNASLLHHYVHDLNNPNAVTEYTISPEDFLTIERGNPPKHYFSKSKKFTAYPQFSTLLFLVKWIKNYLS